MLDRSEWDDEPFVSDAATPLPFPDLGLFFFAFFAFLAMSKVRYTSHVSVTVRFPCLSRSRLLSTGVICMLTRWDVFTGRDSGRYVLLQPLAASQAPSLPGSQAPSSADSAERSCHGFPADRPRFRKDARSLLARERENVQLRFS